MTNKDDVKASLQTVSDSKKAAVKQVKVPWWQDVGIALAMALLTLTPIVQMPFNLFLIAISMALLGGMIAAYTSQSAWVDGWRKGKTRPITYGFAAIFLSLIAVAHMGYHVFDSFLIPMAAAVANFTLYILFSKLWMYVWYKEMGIK